MSRASEILQITPFLDRKPSKLSGGQRQRVAIGRALVRDVDVFLFDEPLSNLDAKLRSSPRVELKRLHQQLANTMIYVTHDQVEAMTLADRIAIMKDGKIQQLGTPDEVYSKPQNLYDAQFIGSPSMNILNGNLAAGAFISGDFRLAMDGYAFGAEPVGVQQVYLGIRPEHVLTGRDVDHAPIRLEIVADLVEPMGSDTLIWSTLAGVPFCVRAVGQMRVAAGDCIPVGIGRGHASMFDAATEIADLAGVRLSRRPRRQAPSGCCRTGEGRRHRPRRPAG